MGYPFLANITATDGQSLQEAHCCQTAATTFIRPTQPCNLYHHHSLGLRLWRSPYTQAPCRMMIRLRKHPSHQMPATSTHSHHSMTALHGSTAHLPLRSRRSSTGSPRWLTCKMPSARPKVVSKTLWRAARSSKPKWSAKSPPPTRPSRTSSAKTRFSRVM